MRVLLTGGAGYIGSHTALVLIEQGHEVVILDDLSNGSEEALRRIDALTGVRPVFVRCDLTDPVATRLALAAYSFDAVIHFAGLKSVSESIAHPSRYYRVNLDSTLVLLDYMRERGITRLVFSSSATIYGEPETDLVAEDHRTGVGITNPYGWSKFMNERIIDDAAQAWPELEAVHLRYFNPVGAHPSGTMGEDPHGTPNNLLPYVAQVAAGIKDRVSVFGDDYPTPDGTGVRDYIHVMDLAEGHAAALANVAPGIQRINLGSGVGTSVIEAIREFERVSGQVVPFTVEARRTGDLAAVLADPAQALERFGWRTRRSFAEACADAWKWQTENPRGYGG